MLSLLKKFPNTAGNNLHGILGNHESILLESVCYINPDWETNTKEEIVYKGVCSKLVSENKKSKPKILSSEKKVVKTYPLIYGVGFSKFGLSSEHTRYLSLDEFGSEIIISNIVNDTIKYYDFPCLINKYYDYIIKGSMGLILYDLCYDIKKKKINILDVVKQVIVCIDFLYRKIKFIHKSLILSNLLVVNDDFEILYPVENKEIKCESDLTVKISNFSKSSCHLLCDDGNIIDVGSIIDGKKEDVIKNMDIYWIKFSKNYQAYDCYTFFTSIMMDKKFYEYALSNKYIIKIWNNLWLPKELCIVNKELSKYRKQSDSTKMCDINEVDLILNKYHFRIDAMDIIKNILIEK